MSVLAPKGSIEFGPPVIVKVDNRLLTKGAKYSYLSTNYQSGVGSLVVTNSNAFSDDDFILLGNFGSEQAEIVQATTVTAATHTLTLAANTKFAHPESTKVTVVPYNKVQFYHTATDTFAAGTSLTGGYVDLQADDRFTRYVDATNTTGYAWAVLQNSQTSGTSTNSNAIPYADFSTGTVERILSMFYSELNNDELTLISHQESMDWLNEAYTMVSSELNLINREYRASSEYSLSVVSGTSEYALPTDFEDVISLWAETDDEDVENIDIKNVQYYDHNGRYPTKYYLRGDYIGFTPLPDTDQTYTLVYSTLPAELTSLYEAVSLPGKAFYAVRDYMLFRASRKIARIDGAAYLELYNIGLAKMKTMGQERSNKAMSFEMSPETNV